MKLDHFHPDDLSTVVIRTDVKDWRQGNGNLKVLPLHDHLYEHTALVKWPRLERFHPHTHWGGEEIFVLDGVFEDEQGRYGRNTWLRNPNHSEHNPFSLEGSLIYVKVGHLLQSLSGTSHDDR